MINLNYNVNNNCSLDSLKQKLKKHIKNAKNQNFQAMKKKI